LRGAKATFYARRLAGATPNMAKSSRISSIVVDQLGARERGLLSLVVAVRRALGPFEFVNGDLSVAVQSALRPLVASGAVLHVDGMYVLTHRARRHARCPDLLTGGHESGLPVSLPASAPAPRRTAPPSCA
jgi:hypothetical protein